MSLSIQTNTDSLIAQENLLTNSIFQSNTIQQLTSGYRINNAGDDPAGLAVANGYASAISELTQGYSNGNDATAQLQIMDGGMSNISQIVNTLQTLATESASNSFTGNRNTLNLQFQTDLSEIDRQAQSIGLNTGGTFAKLMSVYFGAGTGSQSTANGIVNINLSHATVDTQSLGLKGVQAVNTTYDLSAGAANTNVEAMVTNATNIGPTGTNGTGKTTFTFDGAGFGGGVAVTVNLAAVDDATSLANAVNAGIQAAEITPGANAAAFAAANITASIHTNAQGQQQLAFNSSNSAFQVQAGDVMANALMGNQTAGVGNAITTAGSTMTSGGAYMLANVVAGVNTQNDLTFTTPITTDNAQAVTVSANDASGVAHTLTVTLNTTTGATVGAAVTAINAALQAFRRLDPEADHRRREYSRSADGEFRQHAPRLPDYGWQHRLRPSRPVVGRQQRGSHHSHRAPGGRRRHGRYRHHGRRTVRGYCHHQRQSPCSAPRRPPSARVKTSSASPPVWRSRRSPTSAPPNRRFAMPTWRSKRPI